MAITLVTTPDPSAPFVAADYGYQNGLIAANELPFLSVLDNWELVASEPVIKSGTYIRHASSTYLTSGDETISGTPSAGYNYIEITLTGSTLTAAWVTVTTGYTFNNANQGIYNGAGKQLLPDICYLDGADYKRGRSFGMDFNTAYMAGGDLLITGSFDTSGADINTAGGDVNLTTGDVNTGGGDVNLAGGNIDSVLSGAFLIDGTFTTGSWAITAGSFTMVIPSGVYSINYPSASTLTIEHYISGAWRDIFGSGSAGGFIISDGTNYRLNRGSGTGTTAYYGKF